MPFKPKKSAGSDKTSFYDALHGSFEDARRDMHLACKAIGTAEWLVKERTEARNNAYTTHSTLFIMAKRGELSASLFKELNDAEDSLRELCNLLSEAEAQLVAAKQRHAARSARFWQAKANCDSSGCPGEEHDTVPGTSEFSKEEHMGRKAAKKQKQRGWKQDKEAGQRAAFEEATKKPRDAPRAAPRATPRAAPRAAKPKMTAKKPAARPPTYADWVAASKAAFKDYASLSIFPSPPAKPCSRPACAVEAKDGTRVLAACECNIKQGLHFMNASELKSLRLLFHPDKFSKCHADKVALFQKKANEVFVAVDRMYQLRK